MSHTVAVLPPEVGRHIALHCSTASVLRLMLLQRSWYTACESVLYMDVSTSRFTLSRTLKFFRTLVDRPDKAFYVRRLCIGADLSDDDLNLSLDENEDDSTTEDSDGLPETLMKALGNTQRLAHLVLPDDFPFSLVVDLLRSSAFKLQTLVLTVEDDDDADDADDNAHILQLLTEVLPGNPSVKTLGVHLDVYQQLQDQIYLDTIQMLGPLAAAVSRRLFVVNGQEIHVFPDSFTPVVVDWEGFFDDAMCTGYFSQKDETRDVHFHLVLNLDSFSAASSKITASFAQACNKKAELDLILQFVTTYRPTIELDYDAIWACLSPLSPLLKQLDISVIYERSVEPPHFGWRKPDIQISNLTRTEFGLRLERDGCVKLQSIHFDDPDGWGQTTFTRGLEWKDSMVSENLIDGYWTEGYEDHDAFDDMTGERVR